MNNAQDITSHTNNEVKYFQAFKDSIKKVNMGPLGSYIDNSIQIAKTVFIADILLRAFKGFREHFFYTNHYLPEHRIGRILKLVFSYNMETASAVAVSLLIATIRVGATRKLCILPPICFLKFMPLYWLWHGFVDFSHSAIYYATWIRGDHGLDLASGMAASYFHGYLKLILPAGDDDNGIRRRIEAYEQEHNVKFATNKLIVLVPTNMYFSGIIQSRVMSQVTPLETLVKNRAGIKRPYKNGVYRINKSINGTFYYISVEGATPLQTFFETIDYQPSNTWQIKEMKREILLKFYKHLRKLVYGCEETRHEIEFIMYNDYKEDGERQDIGEMLFQHFKELLTKEKETGKEETS